MPHFPEGTHMAKVTGVGFGTTSTGKSQIAISFAGDEGHGTWYGFFTPGGMKQLRKTITALGVPWGDDDDATFDIAGLQTSLLGHEAALVVEMEESDGYEPRLKIQWVNAPGGGALSNPMTQDEVAEFAAQFKVQAAGGADPDLSEIPF